MADSDYEIGAAVGARTDIPTLCGTACHSDYYPWAVTTWKSTGLTRGDGFESCTWTFDYIPQAGVQALRALCTGVSAVVFIKTRTDAADAFAVFECNMHWPRNAQTERVFGGGYKNFEIEFTHLEEVP